MKDRWMIRGDSCSSIATARGGCPCQFGARSTNGFCEAIGAGHIEEGYFNETKLDGLNWILLVRVARRNRGGQRSQPGDYRRKRRSCSA